MTKLIKMGKIFQYFILSIVAKQSGVRISMTFAQIPFFHEFFKFSRENVIFRVFLDFA